jgi:hypothetical protein
MKLIRCLMVHGIVALTSASVYAQVPPRPTVSVRQLRDLQQGVWPADFNRDGRTDLIAGQMNSAGGLGRVVVRLGAGDGTFGPVIATSVISGRPHGTGDFNRDSRQDAVIEEGTGNIVILPGNGDGTFGAPRTVGHRGDIQFVMSSDLSGDGIRDLLIASAGAIEVLAGRGDFTFASPVTLPPSQFGAVAGIIADYNNDGRRDLAVVGAPDNSVAVYLNRGGLLFDIVHEALVGGDRSADITARDLNRDGVQDLIVVHADRSDIAYTNGAVDVLLGHGDGTFANFVRYAAGVNGPVTVVGGDFNGDGLTDVATGNISVEDGFDFKMHYWDSVSILPGSGNGTLGRAAVFRLDTDTTLRDDGEPAPYSGSLHELNTSDVNGDGRTDLITSPGAVVLMRAPAANRLPAVNAGPDVTVPWDIPDVVVQPAITELDWDWLEVEWRDKVGAVVSRVPSFRYLPPSPQGTETLTVTVTDARGGRASDSMVITYSGQADVGPDVRILRPIDGENVQAGAPYRIRWYAFDDDGVAEFDIFFRSGYAGGYTPITECTNLPGDIRECFWRNPNPVGPGAIQIFATDSRGNTGEAHSPFFQIVADASGPGGIPPGWVCSDLGGVAAAGTCSYSAGVFTIEGSGAGIGGTADELRFAGIYMDGAFSLTARVRSVENVNQLTKVGIMIRDWNGGSPGSRHASFLVTPTTTPGTIFQRRATQGGATVSSAGPATTAPIWIKLVRSGNTIRAFYRKAATNAWTVVGTQTFTALPDRLLAMLVVSSHVDGTLATGVLDSVVLDQSEPWTSVDIGGSAAGTTNSDGATVTLEGNGAGIWGTGDAFRFRYTRWLGDGTITARLRSLENTSTGAKAGVMFRESLTAGSKHVFGAVYAAGGVVLQARSATGGTTVEAARRSGTAPEWLRLTRTGNTFTVAASNDGATWATVGTTTVAMGQTIYVGLPVTSRVAGTLATAVFDDLWIRP